MYTQTIESCNNIEFGIDLGVAKMVKCFSNQQKRVSVFNSNSIETPIIDTKS